MCEQLALADVAYQCHIHYLALIFEHRAANFHRKQAAVASLVTSFKCERASGERLLPNAQTLFLRDIGVDIGRSETEQFVARVIQRAAGFFVDINKAQVLINQVDGVTRVVEGEFFQPELLLHALALGNVDKGNAY